MYLFLNTIVIILIIHNLLHRYIQVYIAYRYNIINDNVRVCVRVQLCGVCERRRRGEATACGVARGVRGGRECVLARCAGVAAATRVSLARCIRTRSSAVCREHVARRRLLTAAAKIVNTRMCVRDDVCDILYVCAPLRCVCVRDRRVYVCGACVCVRVRAGCRARRASVTVAVAPRSGVAAAGRRATRRPRSCTAFPTPHHFACDQLAEL